MAKSKYNSTISKCYKTFGLILIICSSMVASPVSAQSQSQSQSSDSMRRPISLDDLYKHIAEDLKEGKQFDKAETPDSIHI